MSDGYSSDQFLFEEGANSFEMYECYDKTCDFRLKLDFLPNTVSITVSSINHSCFEFVSPEIISAKPSRNLGFLPEHIEFLKKYCGILSPAKIHIMLVQAFPKLAAKYTGEQIRSRLNGSDMKVIPQNTNEAFIAFVTSQENANYSYHYAGLLLTKTTKQRLRSIKRVFVDVTYNLSNVGVKTLVLSEMVPHPLSLTKHARPFAIAILCDESAPRIVQILNYLKSQQFNPDYVMADAAPAICSAFRTTFPN
uniref:DUF1308 domain-containing protein n=1 Tax=Rhabditophanes sp. KR3021 TaxID=114890 RepID=A0AC35THX1_9BILA